MDARSPATPTTIGRFRVDAVIGKGGMGEVYKAFDPTLQRTVAVKTVRPDINRPEFLERLFREAQACARLRHPNVVTVYEAGEMDGVVFIAMEYLTGEDLGAVLRRGTLSFEAKIRILTQVLDALHHTHGEGVIHRDIKPSNVHIQVDGSVKVVDFGLARVVLAETLTAPGAVMCTPDYASPEQLRGETLDQRTDIYSTGALAYEMFSGRRPFQGDHDSVGAVVLKVISEPPPPMDVSWSRKFPEIERIVGRAMAKLPAERYQSAEDMRNALSAFLASSRDAIGSAQAEANMYGQRAVIEAKTLIAAGMTGDARTLLAETLRENPDAAAARRLLDQTIAAGRGTADATLPVRREPTPVSPLDTPPQGPQPVAADQVDRARQDRASDPLTSDATTVAAQKVLPRNIWWLGGLAAAIVVVAIIVIPRSPSVSDTEDVWGGATTNPSRTTASGSSAGGPENPPPGPTLIDDPPVIPTGGPMPSDAGSLSTSKPSAGAQVTNRSAPVTAAAGSIVRSPSVAGGPAADESLRAMGAKELFASETGAAGISASAGLRYRLTRRRPDGPDADVDPATTTFRSGDKIRFTFDANIDGYLYVVQQGSSGRWTVLFPGPQINGGRNTVVRSEQYQVPANDWFLFDSNPGTERVFVFFSKEPMSQLPGFDKPVTRTETVVASVVEDLQQRIRSRDLVFEKDTSGSQGGTLVQAMYVVNRAEVSQSVSANITLNHIQ